jgi:hypothetical protein
LREKGGKTDCRDANKSRGRKTRRVRGGRSKRPRTHILHQHDTALSPCTRVSARGAPSTQYTVHNTQHAVQNTPWLRTSLLLDDAARHRRWIVVQHVRARSVLAPQTLRRPSVLRNHSFHKKLSTSLAVFSRCLELLHCASQATLLQWRYTTDSNQLESAYHPSTTKTNPPAQRNAHPTDKIQPQLHHPSPPGAPNALNCPQPPLPTPRTQNSRD